MADDLPFSKISISGPTLSSLLQRFSSSPSNFDGFLYGHVTLLPPPSLSDDDPSSSSSSPSPPPLSVTITSFLSSPSPISPFLNPPNPNPNPNPNSPRLLGWFSARRRSPLRPSMRELSISSSLSKTLTLEQTQDLNLNLSPNPSPSPGPSPSSCVFLLLSSFATANRAVHTHEYRAYALASGGNRRLRPLSIEVVNVGPEFRGQYGAFVPEFSAFPWILPPSRDSGPGVDNGGVMKMDWSVDGFGAGRLEGLVGERAAEYTAELEELYRKMLVKLEGLARTVETSSARILDQESRNVMLRNKIARSE